jgi:hypothetical protein
MTAGHDSWEWTDTDDNSSEEIHKKEKKRMKKNKSRKSKIIQKRKNQKKKIEKEKMQGHPRREREKEKKRGIHRAEEILVCVTSTTLIARDRPAGIGWSSDPYRHALEEEYCTKYSIQRPVIPKRHKRQEDRRVIGRLAGEEESSGYRRL